MTKVVPLTVENSIPVAEDIRNTLYLAQKELEKIIATKHEGSFSETKRDTAVDEVKAKLHSLNHGLKEIHNALDEHVDLEHGHAGGNAIAFLHNAWRPLEGHNCPDEDLQSSIDEISKLLEILDAFTPQVA